MFRDFAGIVDALSQSMPTGTALLWKSVTQKPDCSAISGFATLAAKFSFHESARCFIFVSTVNLEAKV